MSKKVYHCYFVKTVINFTPVISRNAAITYIQFKYN